VRAGALRLYQAAALVLGLACLTAGLALKRTRSPLVQNLSLTLAVVALVILADRLLLVRLGLPLWEGDPERHYRNRPGAVHYWGSGQSARINSHGFNDDEFPRCKPPGEFRILALGNSITMGHLVDRDEAFPQQLERLLQDRMGPDRPYQVINAGVSGYTTYQEKLTLDRTLAFDPDLILIEFCLNDVTEPFIVDPRFGGVGIDYHGIIFTRYSPLTYLLNETGFGRLIQTLKEGSAAEVETALALNTRNMVHNVRDMVVNSATGKMHEGWDPVMSSMDEIYRIGREQQRPVVLLLFPFTFQLGRPETREPQRLMAEHAARHQVPCLDLTDFLTERVREANDGFVPVEQIENQGGDMKAIRQERLRYFHCYSRYFIDEDHPTALGHQEVAGAIYAFLQEQGLLGTPQKSSALAGQP
ncbi:MAG: hypothetical protein C4524_08640, partial [Candidatus Zixiibacteriota bacterium]